MNYKTLTFLIVLVPLLQNCGKKDDAGTQETIHTIEIHKDFLTGNASKLPLEILDTINLEVPGNPPLTTVHDMAFSEDFLLLVDRRLGLLKFDNNGRFLQKIGEKGEGPDEYAVPYAIHLDEKEGMVLVADWEKKTVISYDLEGNFHASSQRLPSHPISFCKENDTLLVFQETLNGHKEMPRQVLVSAIESKTLAVNHKENPLYSFHSNFTIIHGFPRILNQINETSLFYLPFFRGDFSSHSNQDTIFRKIADQLVPEYQLLFRGFDESLGLMITYLVTSETFTFVRFGYDGHAYLLALDLEKKRPLFEIRDLFDQELTEETIPKPLGGDVFYSILRDNESTMEKNPKIVLYRLIFERD